ncbi:hypothetical protein MT356_18525 [Rathayibacter festucae]|nr:hypothetical protein [Rathayibacter festucae]MCJ1701706.1 hypothetical protein [Rathayibacter festucae]
MGPTTDDAAPTGGRKRLELDDESTDLGAPTVDTSAHPSEVLPMGIVRPA